jgi:hypothetical protein
MNPPICTRPHAGRTVAKTSPCARAAFGDDALSTNMIRVRALLGLALVRVPGRFEERRIEVRGIENDLAVVRRFHALAADDEVTGTFHVDKDVIVSDLTHGSDLLAALDQVDLRSDFHGHRLHAANPTPAQAVGRVGVTSTWLPTLLGQ